jgi:site-specific recombinase XerD
VTLAHQELPSEADMAAIYRSWLLWLPAYENKSDDTLRAYGQGLRRMLLYADIPSADFRPEDLTQAVLTDAVRRMRAARRRNGRGEEIPAVSKATLSQTLAAVNSFFDYCLAERLVAEAPDIRRIRKLTKLDSEQVDPEYYRPADLRDLFATAAAPVERHGVRWPVRDLAMCSFLAVLGLRASELCNANLDWITQERLVEVDEAANRMLHVRGKGRKIRRLPLSAELLDANERWQATRGERFGTPALDAPLFLTHKGLPFNYQQLRYWLRRLNREAALRDRSLHALRHTAGVQLAADGVPMNVIQSLLGHASVSTTGIYTELAGGELVGVLNRSEANGLLRDALEDAA